MSIQRGVIRNRHYGAQIRDFSGLRFGNITPTDIDGLIEYHNKGYVLIETKYGGSELPFGQQLAFERLCDDLQNTKPTLLIVASHETDGDIPVSETLVTQYRHKGKWNKGSGTTKKLVISFLALLDNL